MLQQLASDRADFGRKPGCLDLGQDERESQERGQDVKTGIDEQHRHDPDAVAEATGRATQFQSGWWVVAASVLLQPEVV